MSARPYAEVLPDGRLAIRAVKVDYLLTPGEILMLLGSCRSLWISAIRRGKAWRRAEALERRQSQTQACALAAAATPSAAADVMRHELAAPPVGFCGAPSPTPHEPCEPRGEPRSFCAGLAACTGPNAAQDPGCIGRWRLSHDAASLGAPRRHERAGEE
jgi:hypothetical protein